MLYFIERNDGQQRVAVDSETLRRTHLADELFAQAWRMIPSSRFEGSKQLRVTQDLGKPVGVATVIRAPQITPMQPTTFAQRRGALYRYPYRVLESGAKPSTRFVTIIADWHEKQEQWFLRSAYCGQYIYPQPWDFETIFRSNWRLRDVLAFWCRAAYVHVPREFDTPKQNHTWAGLIDLAAKRAPHATAQRIGYFDLRRVWNPEGTYELPIQARTASRAVRDQRTQ